jgi:diguanylate cyclase (GGDEF)-like protein
MHYDASHRSKIGDEAWTRIKTLGLVPDPATFETWFAYVAGSNPSLNDEINDLTANGELSQESVLKAFDNHLSPDRYLFKVFAAGERLRDEVSLVSDLTGAAYGSARDYGYELQEVSDRLSETADGQTVASLVTALIRSTEEIKQTTSLLQTQLEASEAQVLQLRENIEILHVESMTDPLTSVANRKYFEHTLAQMIERSERSDTPLSMVIADVDNFKTFNDSFGHRVGDAVLRLVASAIKASVRGSDVIARYGGDEFAVILPRTSLLDAVAVAQNLRRAVAEKELVRRSTGETLGRITLSVGVAEHERGDSSDAMVEKAANLYAAKRHGRDCVVGARSAGRS